MSLEPSSRTQAQLRQMQLEAEAYAFRQLTTHLQSRVDVQNIDLMILSGFCRNCLSKWYHVGAAKAGLGSSYEDACEVVYGMSYKEWKASHQGKASDEQLKRLEESKAGHAKHEPAPVVPETAPAPPPPPPSSDGVTDVCCVPADELVAIATADDQRPRDAACQLNPDLRPLPTVMQPQGEVKIRLGVLTVSDRASQGAYADLSGPEIESCMKAFAATDAGSRWQLAVTRRAVVPDDATPIAAALTAWSANGEAGGPDGDGPSGRGLGGAAAAGIPSGTAPCSLILTTGGTGLSVRDVTPETTARLLDRHCPGILELLLREAVQIEPLAALSRATAGVRGRTLIINLPGRPKAVRENLAVLMPLLGHALLEVGRD